MYRPLLLTVAVLALVPLSAVRAADDKIPPVPTLDGPQFREFLLQDDQVIVGIVQKGQCGEPCAKVEEFLAKLMQKMTGFFKACIVDVRTAVDIGGGDEKTIHEMFNITNIPLIYIYRYGVKDVKNPMMLQQEALGQLIGAYELPASDKQAAPAQKQVNDVFLQFLPTRVERVNRGNLKEWLQADPTKAKVLLVTAKTMTPSMFTKLSLDYGAGIKFGELRKGDAGAVEELAALGGPKVEKFPKLLIQKAMGEGWAAPTEEYKGALGLVPIGEALAKINPGAHIPELLNEAVLDKVCTSKGGICVVAVLPPKFEDKLEEFKAVASRWFGDSVAIANFAWVNGEKQEEWIDAYKVENWPGLLAFNARKKLFANLVGNFDQENVYNFVRNVLEGKQTLQKISKLPKLEKASPTLPSAALDGLFGKKEL